MTTVASFLREKVTNMATWLSGQGYETKLPSVTDIQLVTFACVLHKECQTAIDNHNFGTLLEVIDKQLDSPEVARLVDYVRTREEMHDKFWRYLTLFSEVASNHE